MWVWHDGACGARQMDDISLGSCPRPRLCPLCLMTNYELLWWLWRLWSAPNGWHQPGIVPSTTAMSIVSHDQLWTALVTVAPVERTKWMTSAWDRALDHGYVHCVSWPTMNCSGDCGACGAHQMDDISLGSCPRPRLCPLCLMTNYELLWWLWRLWSAPNGWHQPGIVPSTTAMSIVSHDQLWTALVTVAPVERTKWMTSAWDRALDHGYVHCVSWPTMNCSGDCGACGAHQMDDISLGSCPRPRLCPLCLMTNYELLWWLWRLWSAPNGWHQPGIVPSTTAMSIVSHDQLWTALVTVAPVERTKWMTSAWDRALDHGYVHCVSWPTMNCSGDCGACGAHQMDDISLGSCPRPRLCPLCLMTNYELLWWLWRLWSAPNGWHQPGIVPSTTAMSIVSHDQLWTALVTVAPVERTKWMTSAWDRALDHGYVHCVSWPTMNCSGDCGACGAHQMDDISLGSCPRPRLCPLCLMTNYELLWWLWRLWSAPNGWHQPGIVPSTTAMSIVSHDQLWTALVTVAPVERTKWMTSAWDRALDHGYVHCVSWPTMNCSGDCGACGAHQMDDISLGSCPRPRLCPLCLMTNYELLWWLWRLWSAPNGWHQPGIVPSTTAMSIVSHDQLWTALVTVAPVERTKWMTSAWDRALDHGYVHCVSWPTMNCSGDCGACGAHQMDDISLGSCPRPRLCPLCLMTNYELLWWLWRLWSAPNGWHQPGIVPSTTAMSIVSHDQLWTALVTVAPVERTKWMTSAWDRALDHGYVHCVSWPTMNCSGDCGACGAHQMDDISLGSCPRPRLCPLCLMTNYELLWWLCLHCGATLDTFSQAFATSHPTPPPSASHPPTPLAILAQNWCAPSKKRSEIAWNQVSSKY